MFICGLLISLRDVHKYNINNIFGPFAKFAKISSFKIISVITLSSHEFDVKLSLSFLEFFNMDFYNACDIYWIFGFIHRNSDRVISNPISTMAGS